MIEDYNTSEFDNIIKSQDEDINQIRKSLSIDSKNVSSLIKHLNIKDKQISEKNKEIESIKHLAED